MSRFRPVAAVVLLLAAVALVAALAVTVRPAPAGAQDLETVTLTLDEDGFEDFIVVAPDFLFATVLLPPEHGDVAIGSPSPSGATVVYQPDPDFNGPDIFLVRAEGTGGPRTYEVTVTVTPVNDRPIAADDDLGTINEDTAVSFSTGQLTGNDSGGPGEANDRLTITSVDLASGGTVAQVAGGVRFTPNPEYSGPASFRYAVTDGGGLTAFATARLTVTAVDEPPVVTPNPIVFTVAEDSGPTRIAYTITSPDAGPPQGLAVSGEDPAIGNFTASLREVEFTPAANASGSTSATLTLTFGGGNPPVIVTLQATVNPVNDPPVFGDGPFAITVTEDQAAGGRVTLPFTDPDDTQFSFFTDSDGGGLVRTFAPSGGSDTAEVTVLALPDAFGTITLPIRVTDAGRLSDTALVTVTVTPVNDPPAATDDTLADTPEDTVLSITPSTLTRNDSPGPNEASVDTLTVTGVDQPVGGTVQLNSGRVISFTPAPDYAGPASFRYTVADSAGLTATATASFTITPVNDPPAFGATDYTIFMTEDQAGRGEAALTFTDVDDTSFAIGDAGAAPDPALIAGVQRQLAFTTLTIRVAAQPNAFGTTSFGVSVTDAHGGTATATVTVTIAPVADSPVIDDASVPGPVSAPATSTAGATVTFTTPTATDPDGTTPTVTCASATGLTSGDTFPIGVTDVTCTATDGTGTTDDTATFTVTVADADGPVITLSGGVQDGQTYARRQLPPAPTCTAVDAIDGPVTCTQSGYRTGFGTHTITYRAVDAAGNETVRQVTYTVAERAVGPTATPRPPTATPTPRPTDRPRATPTTVPTVTGEPTATPTVTPVPTSTPVPAEPTQRPTPRPRR